MSNKLIRVNYNPTAGANTATGVIYDNDASGLEADNVQEALDEIDGILDQEIIDRTADVDAEETRALAAEAILQSNIDTEQAARIADVNAEESRALAAEALLIPLAQKGALNGVATLDAGGKVPVSQLPNAVMTFEGLWDASTNSPALADGTGNAGMVYRISVAGTPNLGSGVIDFNIGDYVIYSGSVWQKSDGTDAVNTVFGRIGTVVATAGDYTASQITNVPAGNLAATDVQAALNELQTDIDTEIANRTSADTSLQSAIDTEELRAMTAETDLAGDISDVADDLAQEVTDRTTADTTLTTNLTTHINNTTDAHDASAISVVPAGNLASTTVQAALEEIQTELDTLELTADNVSYDNTVSGLDGDNVQEAIDQIVNVTKFTSVSLANNVSTPTDVTGFVFDPAVTGFNVIAKISVNATASLFQTLELSGTNTGSNWYMSVEYEGDATGVQLSITSSGQIQYTSPNFPGFVSVILNHRNINDAVISTGGGVTDHGALTGLADDDHTQYHNDTRGDARYYTQTQLNAGQLDTRYYTQTQLNAGQLDNRYYTETEIDNTKPNKALTINTKTTNYTLVLADYTNPTLVRMDVASANTLTIPPNSSVAFPIGTQILLTQSNTGQTTITPGAGVTINAADAGLKTRVQRSVAGIVKVDTDTWLAFGDLTA
jgi:DNA-directed RNA polymerase subunit F